MYTKFKMSFLKQLPPKPGDDFRKCFPILVSIPIAVATSSISAPVFSHNADREFIEEILCASIAFDASFESSEDHTFVVNIFLAGTHFL